MAENYLKAGDSASAQSMENMTKTIATDSGIVLTEKPLNNHERPHTLPEVPFVVRTGLPQAEARISFEAHVAGSKRPDESQWIHRKRLSPTMV